ncbi:radical SAM protein [Pedobacter kyonggii]|nr:radical SAM protein [Pedobacter kyonggii]
MQNSNLMPLVSKKVAIVTNNTNCERHVQYYSTLERYFIANNWIICDSFDVDMVVISGCGFHNLMLEKVKNLLLELESIGFANNVVMTGCIPTTHEEEWKRSFSGTLVKLNFETTIDNLINAVVPYKDVNLTNIIRPHKKSEITEESKIFHIKISNGCIRKCTFCVIYKAKGKHISVPAEEIKAQFIKGIDDGYSKFYLMGEDTFAYGTDSGTTIIELIESLLLIQPNVEFNFSNMDHKWLVEYIDDIISLCKRGAIKNLHLGMQHTNDELLIRMGRGGTDHKKTYDAIVKLKTACPYLFLGVDIIVGFPGETETMFKELLEFFKNEKYIDNVQHNGYSAVEGAPSSSFSEKLQDKVIISRFVQMTKVLESRSPFNRLQTETNFDVTYQETKDNDYSFVKDSFLDQC